MHPIIAMWAVPRSTSTAFEWMMRQRGDLDCLHEPFGEAWYRVRLLCGSALKREIKLRRGSLLKAPGKT